MSPRLLQMKKKQIFIGSLFLILLVILICPAPWLWHTGRLIQGQHTYQFDQVQAELNWLCLHGGILNQLTLITDVDLWLKLNLGRTNGLEEELSSRQGDKYIFWLFLLQLQQNQLEKAAATLNKVANSRQNLLGQGLLSLAAGEPQKTLSIWNDKAKELEKLPASKEALWHLAQAQAEIAVNPCLDNARQDLQKARNLEPQNPACLNVALKIALKAGEWDEALLLTETSEVGNASESMGYLTQEALLALQLQDTALLKNLLAELKALPGGSGYVSYVQGIQALNQGDLEQGKTCLNEALAVGLEGLFKTDAQRALAQTEIRLSAAENLRPIIEGSGE
jgi:hypothetical protein